MVVGSAGPTVRINRAAAHGVEEHGSGTRALDFKVRPSASVLVSFESPVVTRLNRLPTLHSSVQPGHRFTDPWSFPTVRIEAGENVVDENGKRSAVGDVLDCETFAKNNLGRLGGG
jgi:hypothetical protein